MVQIRAGCNCIDSNLGDGVSPEAVTLIYGEPETGKTTLTMQFAANCAMEGKKVLFVDCDNTFYAKRLAEIAGDRFDEVAERIVLVKPKDFKEQTALIDGIQNYIGGNVGLIIIDTFTSLYGARVAEYPRAFTLNRELNRQLAILAQTAKISKIPVIITSQVRAVLSEQNSDSRPVATRVLKFWADNIIALRPTDFPQTIKAVIQKSRVIQQEVTCYIQIGETGIRDAELH